jgi:hypothetical protein
MTTTEIKKRLAALEAEVATLKSSRTSKNRWWDKIAGAFANNPVFDEATANGRKWRESEDRTPARGKKRK